MRNDAISAIELMAYVDGELDDERAVQVEGYLASHPEEAARIMNDLRDRHALRQLASWRPPLQSPGIRNAAYRLDKAFRRRRLLKSLTMAIPALVLALLGIPYMSTLIMPSDAAVAAPAYIDEAIMSHRTTQLRASMLSQPEVAHFDPVDVARATRIRVPRLPDGWRILDAQIFPSDQGPSLQLSIRTEDEQTLSIFAVHATTTAPVKPHAMRLGEESVVYWRTGAVSYALTGSLAPEELDRIAEDLEDNGLA